jgi:hypothetical protein
MEAPGQDDEAGWGDQARQLGLRKGLLLKRLQPGEQDGAPGRERAG